MTVRTVAAVTLVVLWSTAPESQVAPRQGIDWPSFRGIDAKGISDGPETPATFAPASALWKTQIPGLGNSSPVIWGDLLCVTTAIGGRSDTGLKIGLYGDIDSINDDTSHEWKVICLDKRSGRTRWERSVHTGVPKIKRHTKSTHASSTLATDGTRLVAMFGSEGLHVFDLNGKELWKKDFGILDSSWSMDKTAQWDFGSSPVIHDGVVILQADVQDSSFLGAFDLATGKELWRTPRADVPTWSTPAIHTVNGRTQVVVNGWKQTGAYDFKTGKLIWTMNGGGDIPVPTPITGRGLIFLTSAHGALSPVYAIKETAEGDITGTAEKPSPAMAWSVLRDGSYMSTPILYRDLLYVARWNGVLGVYKPTTGERVHQGRLGEGTSAFTDSAVAANDHIYFTSEEGDVYVMRAGTFEIVAKNSLGGYAMATPAISEGTLYFRTANKLIAIKN